MAKTSKTMDGKHWRRWTEDEARATLEELSGSGLSPLEFSRSRGVSKGRLLYWRKRLATPPAFVSLALPVEVPQSTRWVEILVGGLIVRLREDVEAERVASLVGALSRGREGC